MKISDFTNLNAAPFLRHCHIEPTPKPRIASLKNAILREENTHSDFVLNDAPIAPLDQTRFLWSGNDRVLLLGVAFPHCAHAPLYPDDMESESLELLFDLKNDGLGYQQFIFGSDGSYVEYSHLPYPEMHSSAYPLLKPQKWEVETGRFTEYLGGMGCRWFWIRFDAREVFRYSTSVGFNICRARATGEFSAWNFPSGNGAPDASGFGKLYQSASSIPKAARRKAFKPTVARDFKLSVTYDPPDNIIYTPLTPDRISEEMQLFKSWDMARVHWIDYSDFPAIWQYPSWRENFLQTNQACGDLTRCAAQQAHKAGLEFIADFKIFDLGISSTFTENSFVVDKKIPGAVLDLEGDYVTAIPEIASHQEWTLQANHDPRLEYSRPATTLRFFSDEAIREIKPSQIKLLESDDNRTFKPYRGKMQIRQGVLQRPHARWTPQGIECEKGSARNWFLELSGLNFRAAFAALEIAGEPVCFHQRGFQVLEVEDSEGNQLPHTVATSEGNSASSTRFAFWKTWPGWANITEPILQPRAWNGNSFGIALKKWPNMTTILEPTYKGAQGIWLARISKLFEGGADGVNLRLFNHHNGVMSYLQYAFAPIVQEEFRSRFGRDAGSTPEDYERVRRIRGDALTQFVRDARKLADAKGKKLTTQLESGIEVPPHLDTRMQLFIDWKTWIKEGLIEEAHLKFFSPYSRFAHDEILPLARKKDVPVHIISRNLSSIVTSPRSLETAPRQIADARKFGFSGFNFYEAGDLYERNNEGGIWMKGLAPAILQKVCSDLSK